MTPDMLRRLADLLEARKARDLTRLQSLVADDRRLADEVADLAGTAARDLAEGGEALPLPQQALRQLWADGQIRAAGRRRAELAPRIRAARAEAVQSLGKHRAMERLVERAEQASEQRRIARSEREAPPSSPAGPGAPGHRE